MSNTSILANSIWPNGMQVDADGYAVFYELGTNKVDIPTNGSQWPKGNKLVSPFVYRDDKLVGFCDTKAMEVGNATTIVMPYEHIEADFSSIDKGTIQIATPKATFKKASWKNDGMDVIPEAQYKYKGCKTVDIVKAVDSNYRNTDIVDGIWTEILCDLEYGNTSNGYYGAMFYNCSNLTTFTSDLSSLTNGQQMFYNCSNLTTFTSDLSSLTNGNGMFAGCPNLTTFTSDLSSLTNGGSMFGGCSSLTTFTSKLSSLTNGQQMFNGCSNLTTFTSNLSSLTDGSVMFTSCTNLTTFTSNLSSLTNGNGMFNGCSSLTEFSSDLSSLTNGNGMFNGCMLDGDSIKNIIDTINTYSGRLDLGMGCNNTTEDKDLFAQEVGYADMTSLLAVLQAKGWYVTAQYNGRPTTTYALRRPTEDTLPIYAKLEEVILPTEEEIALAKENGERIMTPHYEYTSEDGSKFFNINWFHETTGSTEGYTQFNSLVEAIETFNIKQVERN